MLQILQCGQGLHHDVVARLTSERGNKRHAAGIPLKAGIIKALSCGQVRGHRAPPSSAARARPLGGKGKGTHGTTLARGLG